MREHIATVTIPEDITKAGNYCLKLEVVGENNEFKRGYSFEGIGLTEHI